jgi:acyl-CoA reductase-like NAD-dependent aldehyde dehydrogenase
MQVINPATEEIITHLPEDSVTTLDQKLKVLREAQPGWRSVDLEKRIGVLTKFAELLKQNVESLSAILTSEVGKPLQQSRNEINGAANRVIWLTNNAFQYLKDEVMFENDSMTEMIKYEPLGVICNISAWNFPYNVGVNVFVPALIAGNAVMYKPSEYSSLTGLEIEKLLKEAGIPQNVFQVAIGSGEVGSRLLEMNFDGYFFTGSYKTGQYIYEKVAPKMVPCQLELGGKDPVYVADDVENIKSAAAGIADGAFYNNGQSCCAVERVYVHEKIYDEYVKEFVNEVNSWKTGLPTEDGVYISVVSRKPQVDILEEQVKDAVSKGAKILTGGKRKGGKGYGFEPTVLVDVNHQMSVMKDESFGPVIGIMKVKNDEEAYELMKDTEYGLTAAVYSKSQPRAFDILEKLDSGTAYWNCCDRVSAPVPWSGRKHSGFGSTLSHMGIRAFTKPKAYQLRKK